MTLRLLGRLDVEIIRYSECEVDSLQRFWESSMKERDPDRMWLDDGRCYLELIDGRYAVVHDDEQLAVYRGPEVLLQTTILRFGDETDEGLLVKAAAVPWFEILKQIARDPEFMFKFAQRPRKFEEFLAGAYRTHGWDDVTLTPASADRGRDVIATKPGFYSIRVLDQAKAFSPGHLVDHNDVRAMLGVLSTDQNALKGLITTTSDFAPTILAGDEFSRFIPYRLELKNGSRLLKWLSEIQQTQATPSDKLSRSRANARERV
jgi:restriction system protein